MGISMDAVISRSVSIPRKCKGERTMAQRLIHYLFGDIFSKQMPALDRNRFLLGSVLPDAYANAADRDRTHFIKKNDTQVYFDFEKFDGESMSIYKTRLKDFMNDVKRNYYFVR